MRWSWLESHLPLERLPQLVTWGLAAGLLYSFINFVWLFKPVHLITSPIQPGVTIKPLPSIAHWHLFGAYRPTSGALLQRTQLPLQLSGVFYATTSAASSVLIQVSGREAKLFVSGQTVLPGVTIEEILRDGVILKHNEKLELLPLPVPQLKFAPPPRLLDLNQGT